MGRKSREKKGRRAAATRLKNVTPAEVDELLSQLGPGEASLASLAPEQRQLTFEIVQTWAYLMEKLRKGKLTIAEMRRLAGIMAEAQKRRDDGDARGDGDGDGGANAAAAGDIENGDEQTPSARDDHGRRDLNAIGAHEKQHHQHNELKAGDPCPHPDCTGRLYEEEPQVFVTISAAPPFHATEHTVEQLACNLCKTVFPAAMPPEVKADLVTGNGAHLYAISAAVMMTLLRYFSGFPWYRQEGFFSAVGGPRIPDSSMADQSEKVADAFTPIASHLRKMAAGAWLYLTDDTGGRILSLKSVIIEQRRTGEEAERVGCHTTATIAQVKDGDIERKILLFDTGIHYAGEVLDDLLRTRPAGLPAPCIVGDGSSQNDVTVCATKKCGCNGHSIRKFKEAVGRYPNEAGRALKVYDQIYTLEDEIVALGLSREERLARHREVSKPLLDDLCRYGQSLFDDKRIEPNSGDIGDAFNYLLNQQRSLMAFTRYPGVPLDNNEDERAIKLIVLVRKNSLHFASPVGAGHADVLWTCGATAKYAGENLWDYFTFVVRHKDRVRKNPAAFLPWTWRTTQASDAEAATAKNSAEPV
jgi:transposase